MAVVARQHITVSFMGSDQALFEFAAQDPPSVLDVAFDKLGAGAEVQQHGVAVTVGQPGLDLRRRCFGEWALCIGKQWRCDVSVREVLCL